MQEFKHPTIPDFNPNLAVPFSQTADNDFRYLRNRKLYIHHTIQGVSAATAGYYGVFWIAPFPCVVTEFREVHQVAGNDAGAVSVTLEKLTGTTAPDSGTAMLTAAISLKGTANTVVTGTLTSTIATNQLSRGDRLCLKDSGVLTTCSNVTIYVEINY